MNICSRCGKERIVTKTWKEKMENAGRVVEWVFEETKCPDKECQKIVEKELVAKKKKKDELKAASDQRVLERKQRMQVGAKVVSH